MANNLSNTVYVAEIDPSHPLMRVARVASWVRHEYQVSKKNYNPPIELAEAMGALNEALDSSKEIWQEDGEDD